MSDPRRAQAFERMTQVQAAHAAGDALVAIALAGTLFFSVPLGEARDKVALYLLLTMTPFALLSPVLGPLLDRRPDAWRVAIVVSLAGRALLAFMMTPRTGSLTLYPIAFGVLVLSRAHGIARAGLVPSVLPPERALLWANGRLAAVSFLAGSLAALPGIGVQRLVGPGATLGAAGVVLIVGAISAASLPRAEAPGARREIVPRAHRSLASHLLAAGAAAGALRFAVGFLVFFMAFQLRELGYSGVGFGTVLACAAAGGFAGSLVAPALRGMMRGARVLLLSLGVLGATALLVATSFRLGSAAFLAFVSALCASAGRLGFDSLLQRDAPEEVRGRAFSRYETIFQLAWVGGAGLATGISFGARTGLRTVAVVCIVGVILAVRGAMSPRASDAA